MQPNDYFRFKLQKNDKQRQEDTDDSNEDLCGLSGIIKQVGARNREFQEEKREIYDISHLP